MFRSQLVYRRDEFLHGLKRIGFDAVAIPKRNPHPSDLLLLWNRTERESMYAAPYERVGATVIIAENGYIPGGDGAKRYALALNHHNGAGRWPVGGDERFERLGVQLNAWRSVGDHVVMLPQRGIGLRGVAMPGAWAQSTLQELQKGTLRRVLFRRHPGAAKSEPYDDLRNAHAAVTWGSGAAIKALAVGIPVFHAFPQWIGAASATPFAVDKLEHPLTDDGARLQMFRRLAWAQWSMGEIVSGEAFAWLLQERSPASAG